MDAHPLYLWRLADLFHWIAHVPMLAIVGVLFVLDLAISGLRSL